MGDRSTGRWPVRDMSPALPGPAASVWSVWFVGEKPFRGQSAAGAWPPAMVFLVSQTIGINRMMSQAEMRKKSRLESR